MIEARQPDVVVLDLALKESSGFTLLRELKGRFKGLRILVLSMYDEDVYAERAIRAGASGYAMKGDDPQQVLRALRRILAGGVHVSDRVSAQLLLGMREGKGAISDLSEQLSDRELQVFQMLGEGQDHAQIAGRLTLSVKTVESYVEQIKKKLGLQATGSGPVPGSGRRDAG